MSNPTNGSERPRRRLMLFVAGEGSNSILARTNLQKLQEAAPAYELEVEEIDVLVDFRAAQEHGVLVTPCLILLEPGPRAVLVGTLKDTAKVRAALRMTDDEVSYG